MESIGSRELPQSASEYVKRAENGEQLSVAVAGRPAAVLGPVMDLVIAATARAHGAGLVTRNGADLRGAEHLVEIVAG